MPERPATIDTDNIIANPNLDGQTDGGTKPPSDATANNATRCKATKNGRRQMTKSRILRFLPPTLGIAVLAGIIFGLHGALKHIRPQDVLAALAATSAQQILHAFALLACSFCIMAIYDVPGILFAKKLLSVPPLGPRRIGLASFSAYALSHVLGAPALTGAAIRLRLYAEWLVPSAGIARIIALSGTNFILGAALLSSGILLIAPHSVPLFGHDISTIGLRAIGTLLLGFILLYILLAGRRTQATLFGWQIPLPGSLIAVLQLLVSCADTTIAGGILFVILPATHGLSLPHVLAIYLAAFAGGLFSGLPGGLGVFDTLLLLGLSPYMDPATAIGAILLFRVIYFLVPAGAAGLCFAAHEIFLTAKGQN
jgi:uncharacterized membrane protein YbhN (UPF0104 family)